MTSKLEELGLERLPVLLKVVGWAGGVTVVDTVALGVCGSVVALVGPVLMGVIWWEGSLRWGTA